jgi:CRP/FNR family transcriptional regulator, polysaccharide utilization system transcription regulator
MAGVNIIESCESCTMGWKNFQHLTKSELQLINENRYEATFKPGEIILKEGSPASYALFLAGGMAKVYMEGAKGKNFIMHIALPGRLIMGPGIYGDSRYPYSVSALTIVHACFISFDIFRQMVRTNGAFAESLLEDISSKSLKSLCSMVNMAQKRMSARIADALLYFSEEVFMADEFDVMLSRQELGEMTNMAKECVVRILKDLENSGIISSESSRIRIIEKEKLIQIAEKG